MTSILRLTVAATVLAAALCLSPSALAQAIPTYLPQQRTHVDERGVDLVSLSLWPSQTVVSIGPALGGLAEIFEYNSPTGRFRGRIDIKPRPGGGSGQTIDYQVTIGKQTRTFASAQTYPYSNQPITTPLQDTEKSGSTLERSANDFLFKGADGTVAHFDAGLALNPKLIWGSTEQGGIAALLTVLSTPDGYEIRLTHKTYEVPNVSRMVRVQSINTNSGYQLKYWYANNDDPAGQPANWNWVNQVVALNNAFQYCDPVADDCALPAGWEGTWPRGMFGTSSGSTYVTDARGNVTTYRPESIKLPSGAQTTLTAASPGIYVWTNGQEQITYTSTMDPDPPHDITISVTGPPEVAGGPPTNLRYVILSEKGDIQFDQYGGVGGTGYGYDSFGRLGTLTSDGITTTYVYDDRGNILTTTVTPKAGSGLAPTTTEAGGYPACTPDNFKICNKPAWTRDAFGKQTDYTYDSSIGQVTSVTFPAPSDGAVRPQTRYAYQLFHAWLKWSPNPDDPGYAMAASPIAKLVQSSSCATLAACDNLPDEVRTTTTYESGGESKASNVLPLSVDTGNSPAVSGAVIATVATTYTKLSDPQTVDGPLPGTADTSVFHYDLMRNMYAAAGPDPDGSEGALRYRAVQNWFNIDGQIFQIDVGTVTDQWYFGSFVPLSQAVTTFDPVTTRPVRTVKYGSGSGIVSVVDLSYDYLGRRQCTAVRMNPQAWSTWTPGCTANTPGLYGPDRIGKSEYDAAGRVTKTWAGIGTSAEQVTATFTYAPGGQLAQLVDGNGNLTNNIYDGFNRLRTTFYPSPTNPGLPSNTDYEQYSYYADGTVATFRRRDATLITYQYDALRRLIFQDQPSTSMTYDNLNRVSHVSTPTSSIWSFYDALGRIVSRQDDIAVTTFEYDLAGRRIGMTWPDGVSVRYTYDNVGAMKAVFLRPFIGAPLETIASYVYDDLGRRIQLWRGNGSTHTQYGYDGASNLTGLQFNLYPVAASHALTKTFEHNPAGQIIKQAVSNPAYVWDGDAGQPGARDVNGLNQMTLFRGQPHGYDAKGNLATDGYLTYSYDAANRLIGTTGTKVSSLSYDAEGHLYRYAVTGGEGPLRFLYDGANLSAEYDDSGQLLRRYIYGARIDEPLLQLEGAGLTDRRYLYADERGSIVATLDNASAPIGPVNAFDEYGRPRDGNQGHLTYTGQLWLWELGLYHYRSRAYSPSYARFLQTDPIGYAGGINLYAYVGGDPINLVDPLGLINCVQRATRLGGCSTGGTSEPIGYIHSYTEVCSAGSCVKSRESPETWTPVYAHTSSAFWVGVGLGVGAGSADSSNDPIPRFSISEECYGDPYAMEALSSPGFYGSANAAMGSATRDSAEYGFVYDTRVGQFGAVTGGVLPHSVPLSEIMLPNGQTFLQARAAGETSNLVWTHTHWWPVPVPLSGGDAGMADRYKMTVMSLDRQGTVMCATGRR